MASITVQTRTRNTVTNAVQIQTETLNPSNIKGLAYGVSSMAGGLLKAPVRTTVIVMEDDSTVIAYANVDDVFKAICNAAGTGEDQTVASTAEGMAVEAAAESAPEA